MNRVRRHGKKTAIAIAGSAVVIVGVIMIPAPGPGWLVVFAGLGILSTEFEWAGRLLKFAQKHYKIWETWVMCQSLFVRAVIGLLSAILVILSIWVINGYGFVNDWLHLEQPWLRSPFLW